jgi:hypothetical protein
MPKILTKMESLGNGIGIALFAGHLIWNSEHLWLCPLSNAHALAWNEFYFPKMEKSMAFAMESVGLYYTN